MLLVCVYVDPREQNNWACFTTVWRQDWNVTELHGNEFTAAAAPQTAVRQGGSHTYCVSSDIENMQNKHVAGAKMQKKELQAILEHSIWIVNENPAHPQFPLDLAYVYAAL